MKKQVLQEAMNHIDEDLIQQATTMLDKKYHRTNLHRIYYLTILTIVIVIVVSVAVVSIAVWGVMM